jgi:DNA-binding transcriptional LysR family regulator
VGTHPDLNPLDARLLSVFDEIYKNRSVSRTAEALGLGQPAVSIALGKLRQQFADPLFVRTAAGMKPTPLCESLVAPVREALEALDRVLGQRLDFDPTRSTRCFRLCMTDISQLVLLPGLWARLRRVAPGVQIEVLPLSGQTAGQLEAGEADLAIGFMPQLEAGFYQQALFRQDYVCLVSTAHPRIGESLSRAQFEAEEHATVSTSGTGHLIVERELARQGVSRRVVLQIPNFVAVAFVIEQTDLIITIPRRLGEVLAGRGQYRCLPVPVPLPEYTVKQHWHERFHRDPGNRWLRSVIAELLSEGGPVRAQEGRPFEPSAPAG